MMAGRSNALAWRGLPLLGVVVCAVLGAQGAGAHGQCGYEISGIIFGPWCPGLGRSPITRVLINDAGVVAGAYTSCFVGPGEAFVWTRQTGLVTLDRPPGALGAGAFDIADDGVVVGSLSVEPNARPRAVMWVDGVPIDLGIPPGGNHSSARGINTRGQVVGQWGNSSTGDPSLQAFLWQDGQLIDLGPDLGTPNGSANDVNDAGQVVGWKGSALSSARGFIWDGGRVTELPPIPGGFTSEAHAISNTGHLVGAGRVVEGGSTFTRAMHYDLKSGVMTNLGTLPGFSRGGALDVNDDGVVVGTAWTPGETGFVWRDGVMRDLGDFIAPEWEIYLKGADSINSRGQIAVRADLGGQGVTLVGVILDPVMAPAGDVTCDGAVDEKDLAILIQSWGLCEGCPADLDGDLQVGILDLLILLRHWG
jgi:probable HAF family extracellular repeat protein